MLFTRHRTALNALLLLATPLASAEAQLSSSGQPHPVGDLGQIMPLSSSTSPFPVPEASDMQFVIDRGPGLDTGCQFASSGDLVFSITVDRFFGDVDKLRDNGLISESLTLVMPAFDVDFDAVVSGIAPERDEVYFNGNLVPGKYLTGLNGTWVLNAFSIPIEWVNLPEPDFFGSIGPVTNEVRIVIDTGNPTDQWCTAIDWAALIIDNAPRPVVFAHGILSSGETWGEWAMALDALGIPSTGGGGELDPFGKLDLGALDSIQDNAAEIVQRIEAARSTWKVDRVQLVTHSKGGLDSRLAVEGSSAVERLIQIGTPNGGAPLADLVQSGFIKACAKSPVLCLVGLAQIFLAPAGFQLTTGHMQQFNTIHGLNPKVDYLALGSVYTTNCIPLSLPCVVDRVLMELTGTGDLIVPLTSVHEISGMNAISWVPAPDTPGAKHTGQTESAAIIQILEPFVVQSGLSIAGAGVTEPHQGPGAILASDAGVLTPGGTVVFSFAVSETMPLSIAILHDADAVDLVVVGPDGIPVVEGSATAGITFGQSTVFDFAAEMIAIDEAAAGPWTVMASVGLGVDVGTGIYIAGALADSSPVSLSVQFDPPLPKAGDTVLVAVETAIEGVTSVGGSAEALALSLDGELFGIALADDGLAPDAIADDGVFTGSFVPTAPGLYRMRAASVDGSGVYQAELVDALGVSASQSSLALPFVDYGADLDGDGFFDELVLEVSVQVDLVADYRVVAELRDAAGTLHRASAIEPLATGLNTVALSFEGELLYGGGVDGPYTISQALLVEPGDPGDVIADLVVDGHTTAAYPYTAFEHAPVSLGQVLGDAAIDTGGAAAFDFLDITVEVLAEEAGFYQWSGRLEDVFGTQVDLGSGSGILDAGSNDLIVRFDGEAIGLNGIDGPYFLSDMLVFGQGTLVAPGIVGETTAYAAVDFEGFVGTTRSFGCGASVTGSLFDSGSTPVLGGEVRLSIDNPVGSQTPGSLSYLAISLAPDASFPCGDALPGLGMAPGTDAELLVDLGPQFLTEPCLAGPAWGGPGAPAEFVVPIPDAIGLLGAGVYFQGAIVDVDPASEVLVAVTEGLLMMVGP